MANGIVVQLAVLSVLAAVSLYLIFVYRRRKAPPKPMPMPTQPPAAQKPLELESVKVSETVLAVHSIAANAPPVEVAEKPPVVLQAKPLANPEDRNQRILAGISVNIRRSVIKPVPTYSLIQNPETPRDTEYVRVKKKILTPHGQVRFSILKDSIAINMLAIFRRACMDWKTPQDLIAFLPLYLEPEAEIFNNQLLLVGTPGHNEKLAIPIRSDLDAAIRDCFDFVTDDRTAVNTPAVLITDDDGFEIVSRGVITQPVFLNPERSHTEVKFLVEKYPEVLQNG